MSNKPQVDPDGIRRWYDDGLRHRVGGPAVEFPDGGKSWWRHGQIHRDGGPACEHANGGKSWWLHGVRHRDGGPAIELANGTKIWYRRGRRSGGLRGGLRGLLGNHLEEPKAVGPRDAPNGEDDMIPGPVSTSYPGPPSGTPKAVLSCAFCGEEYPDGTPASKHERLTQHIMGCRKHPLRGVILQRDKAIKLVRAWMKEWLKHHDPRYFKGENNLLAKTDRLLKKVKGA